MSFLKKTIFWENVKKSIAVFGAPGVVGIHEFGGADIWMRVAGGLAVIGAVIAIWMVDNDKDGVVDLFQEK